MRRSLPTLLGALLLFGCETGFRLETRVEDLRLLGISANPPVLRPGQTALLSALVLDPSRAEPATVLWLGCEPDPFNLNRSPCANTTTLQDPGALTGGTGTLPPGVSLIGFNAQAAYAAPAGTFDVLAPDDPRRVSGTVGQILAFAIAEAVSPTATPDELREVFGRVERKELKSIIAMFRVGISEQPEPNQNPVVDALVVGGEPWPRGARALVLPGEPVKLDLTAPASAFEPYVRETPSGPEERVERIQVAWYSTSGRFTETTTALGEAVQTIFTAAGGDDGKDPVPERRAGTLYTVLRDTRGGQAWRQWPYFVCEPGAAVPVVSQVDWPADAASPVVLRGEALESVVDLIVDGVALERGGYVAATGTWQGFLPADVPVGAARGVLHLRDCARRAL